jgi:hypothetical protein
LPGCGRGHPPRRRHQPVRSRTRADHRRSAGGRPWCDRPRPGSAPIPQTAW